MPLQVQATATATGATLVWQRIAGASSYTVHRWKRLENNTRCCDTHVRRVSAPRFVDEPLPGSGRYLYRVVAHLPNGASGFEERTLVAPAGATQTAAGAPPSGSATGTSRAPDSTTATIVNPYPPRDIAQRMPPSGSTTPASGSTSVAPAGGTAATPPASLAPDPAATGSQPVATPPPPPGV